MAASSLGQPRQAEEIVLNDSSSQSSHRIIERFTTHAQAFRDKLSSYDDLRHDFECLNELAEQTCRMLSDEVSKREAAEMITSFHLESVKVLQRENEKSRTLINKLWDTRIQLEKGREGGVAEVDVDTSRTEQADESMEVPRDCERTGRTLRRSSIRVSRQRSLSADILVLTEKTYDTEQPSLFSRTHSFRALSNRMIYAAADQDEEEEMFPRCKALKPYLMWEKQIVPDDVVEEMPNLPPPQLLSRVYCNCGMPLTQEDFECECPLNKRRRHKFFNRRNFYDFGTRSSPILLPDGEPLKNVVLPSISAIDRRGAPTAFDLVAQVSALAVERRPRGVEYDKDPTVTITVWDGSVPPNFICNERFLRDLKTDADKVVLGGPLPWDMPGMLVDVRVANVKKMEAGEFVVFRDVIIVMACSVGEEDRSLSPVWMLQARDVEVIRETPKDPEILSVFMRMAKTIATCIILMGVDGEAMSEEIWEEENSFIAFLDARVKRKTSMDEEGGGVEGEPASKRPDLEAADAEPLTWMAELAALDEMDRHQRPQERLLSLSSTHGSFDPPTACFESFPENHAKFLEFMNALVLQQELPTRHVWLCWMTTCHTENTIRNFDSSKRGCCRKGCNGGTSLYVHIPMESRPDPSYIHLLINAAHFRKGKKPIARISWNRRKEKNQFAEFEKIVNTINESKIVLHRAAMLALSGKIVYVVSDDPDWITVADR